MIFGIKDVRVMGVEEALIESGYPKDVNVSEDSVREVTEKDWIRGENLGRVGIGSGHDSFLKGILVKATIGAPMYWWAQFQRYHFADIVSSQSKMHTLTRMNIDNQCNDYVDPYMIKRLKELIHDYNVTPTQTNFQRLMANTPSGLILWAGVTTNYLQLKTMKSQRETHRLVEWSKYFVPWVDSLPHFVRLTEGA